jgi:hypothetical protein
LNYKSVKSEIARHWRNLPGWTTKRKIIVFESDDWGSIRMPSKEVYNACLKAGYPVDKNVYEKYDTLESEDDLELLFELLRKYRDSKGNPPVITANCLVANPDFEAIQKGNFERYQYELVTETFKNYPNRSGCFKLWKDGLNENIFKMQFHGREHLNVSLFMNALQRGDRDALFGFALGMPGCISLDSGDVGNYYVEATRFNTESDKEEKLAIISEGLDIFKNLIGYQSESLIPPNYTWSLDFDEPAAKLGVKYFQGYRKVREPGSNGAPDSYYTHYLGKTNKSGQLYLIRNCTFEPSLNHSGDAVEKCIMDIASAFRMNKPAILSTHRINFAGSLDPDNRDKTLGQLNILLGLILKRWPDVEFMASDNLGRLIHNEVIYRL